MGFVPNNAYTVIRLSRVPYLVGSTQVSGAEGTKLLAEKVAANGPTVLFEGALATATATFVGHYPW